ncbi:RagB/SusD family nutrient uptake outer membrane protein [Pinibacter soli]|uniref:RagB/SusD family nutrient uptake outer membrane protein n=1 Tax=Pinibacter soli TaxID=3044211 RepID=A0ABT6RJG7_9BACT|nr:RagB/SusD family nutrient uptake outer membrane protein [Pinibacter soli]MDI3322713.1 RagB/SusD family nutrient uptake outer membrane protein [Pinibacter soli]
MNKKIVSYLLICILLGTFSSCNKALDVQSSRLAPEANSWKRLEDTRASLMGMYGLMRAALAEDNAHWLWGELRGGDFTSTSRSDLKAIINGNLNYNYPTLQTLSDWRRFYAVINSASTFIEHSGTVRANDQRYTEANWKADVAQARVMRAFAYFYMSRIWGNVPLITTSEEGEFVAKPATDQTIILNFAETEILKCINDLPGVYAGSNDPLLPNTYYGQGPGSWYGILITKYSAYAILAHIAAWQGHYIDCDAYTSHVVNELSTSQIQPSAMRVTGSNYLSDPTQSGNLFTGNNQRQILAFAFGATENVGSGHLEELTLAAPFVSKSVPDMYVSKDSITSIFPDWAQPGIAPDPRFGRDSVSKLYYEKCFTNFTGEIPVFSKVKCVINSNKGTLPMFNSAIVFTRLEEIKLLRAEALYNIWGPASPEAVALLNDVRSQRGVAVYDSRTDLLDAIFAERRKELIGEGWRWYDLVRYKKIKDPTFVKNMVNTKGIYWPVSVSVLATNPKLSQNSYWN